MSVSVVVWENPLIPLTQIVATPSRSTELEALGFGVSWTIRLQHGIRSFPISPQTNRRGRLRMGVARGTHQAPARQECPTHFVRKLCTADWRKLCSPSGRPWVAGKSVYAGGWNVSDGADFSAKPEKIAERSQMIQLIPPRISSQVAFDFALLHGYDIVRRINSGQPLIEAAVEIFVVHIGSAFTAFKKASHGLVDR
jgi:hypothetical protein